MRENSRRGAPRQARPGARAGSGRDTRGRASAGRGSGPGAGRPGYDGGRPGPGHRGSSPGSSDTARLAALIEPVLHALDMDLETVKVGTAGRRRVLRIIVDADGGVDLDDIAEVSREVSAKLDAANAMGDAPYTLEVSSPGVDRPLTQPRHWRRATGRLVVVEVAGDEAADQADPRPERIVDADQQGVTLERDGTTRTVRYADLGPGRVQVEFGRLAGEDDDEAGQDGGAGPDGSAGSPEEEGPDGH
ncbi:MAG TPA: ribosome maturation factor RimP [Streptosporangiaceae bacterium]